MTEKQYEFTGGNKLKGIYKDYHHIMMQNELKGGECGYELRWAKGKSGPSFGGNQMDIAHNAKGRKVLLNIVNKAVDASGKPFLTQQEIGKIQEVFENPKQMIGRSHADIFVNSINKVQAALQSPYGKKMIDQAYVNEVLWRAYKVEKFIESLDEGHGKNFAKTTLGKLCIFDFDNQYEIEKTGALYHFLNGSTYTFKSGKVVGPITKPDFNAEDLKKGFCRTDIEILANEDIMWPKNGR